MSFLARISEAHDSLDLSSGELSYYARHILLPGIGTVGQKKLKAARVLVVGAGGLGCPVLQALAGAGVGRLTVVDGDAVGVSNLSRQWLHRYADAGHNKALSAQAALQELNPFIDVSAQASMLTSENADELVEAHDLVIDGTDELEARYWIDDACARHDRPWVHAALYRERAQLTVFWGSCGATFRKLYPEPVEAPSCAGAGMLGASASMVGNLQALEAIRLITASGRPQVGRLVSFDSAGLSLQSFQLPDVEPPRALPDSVSSDDAHRIEPEALRQALSIHEPLMILDIRSRSQCEAGTISGAEHCPAEAILEEGLPECRAGRIILYCQEGSISRLLVEALKDRSGSELLHLKGGFEAWNEGQ